METNENKDTMKGKLNQATGAVRENVGDAMGNEEMERNGAMQHAKGDAQEAGGKIQGAVKDAVNTLKDGADKAADKAKEAVRR